MCTHKFISSLPSAGTGPTGVERRAVEAAPLHRTLARCLLAIPIKPVSSTLPSESQRARGAGFRLFHLYELWSHPDGQVTAADALYLNERFFRRA